MNTKKATVGFPPALKEEIKLSLREFMVQNRPCIDFTFEDDPRLSEPYVTSLEAMSGSCGSANGSEGLAVEANISGLQGDLATEYRRIRGRSDG